MHHDGVHPPAFHVDHHVQQPALLEAVVGNVLVVGAQHRPAREQRVAVLAMARDGVGLVDGGVALGREEVGLRQLGPARETRGRLPVHLSHFLQADDVGVELLDGMAQVVDLSRRVGPMPCTPLWML